MRGIFVMCCSAEADRRDIPLLPRTQAATARRRRRDFLRYGHGQNRVCAGKLTCVHESIAIAKMYRYIPYSIGFLGCVLGIAVHAQDLHPRNDYPTAARADYVIGCLAANGMRRELLSKCACGIDIIADQLSYQDYETATTVLSMQQGGLGDRGAIFRDTPIAKAVLEKLRRAQAEANLRCG
jgi:hypothetical protein